MKELSLRVGNVDLATFVSAESPDALIALRPLVECLGMSWSTQAHKILRNPQFTCVHMNTHDSIGREQEMLCIPVQQVGMWLCTVNANKVRADIKDKVLQFQMHLQVVIHDALTGRVTREAMQRLEAMCVHFQKQLAEQQRVIDMLVESSDYISRKEASCAASRLASQRKLNKLSDQVH